MVTTQSKPIVAMAMMVAMFCLNSSQLLASPSPDVNQIVKLQKGNDELKYGQYVYVTLKDGTRTVGKIVGKKNSKKYYVNQLDGSNRGLVNRKYIQKMTKKEIASYKSNTKTVAKHR